MIKYVGGQVGGRAGSTSTSTITFALTGGIDTIPRTGDLVVIEVVVATQARNPACAIATPTGYTALGQLNVSTTTYDTSLNVSWKIMGGTADTTFTLPSTGNVADAQRWAVKVFRYAHASPIGATASATGSATGRPNPPSITPTNAGAHILICGGGAAATGAAYTGPANFTTGFLTGTTADTNDAMVGMGHWEGWTSGAVDPAQYTGGTTNAVDSWAAYTIEIKPAARDTRVYWAELQVPAAPVAGGYTLTAQGGSYSLTGASAILRRDKYLIAQGGTYTYTGQQATITYSPGVVSYVLTAQGGNYSLAGASVQISRNRNIAASGGTYAISGAQAILAKHRYLFNSGGSYNITGASASLRKSKVILAQGGTYSLAGAQAILSKIRTLIAQGGSYSVTGASAALRKSRVIAAVGGVYGVAGAAAILKRGRLLTASGGSYTVGGAQASLARNRVLIAQGGAYSFDGNSVVITYTGTAIFYTLTAQGGSYSIGGASAVLQRSRLLMGQGGSYSLEGQTAILSRHRYIQGQGGSYSIVGQDATLLRSKVLGSQGGTYTVAGANAQIHRNRKLIASGGIYNYTGRSAVITYTGIGGVWPQPGEVLLGVQYGPNGNDYTGTLNAYGIKYDINTGRLVKPMTDLVVVSFGERA